jgi:hypothetical protein
MLAPASGARAIFVVISHSYLLPLEQRSASLLTLPVNQITGITESNAIMIQAECQSETRTEFPYQM